MDENRDTTAGGSGDHGVTGGQQPADETFAWTASDAETDSAAAGGDARATAERMLAQLQSMIDQAATLAAPIAHRAADATADASGKLAVRSRTWAAELRSKLDEAGNGSDKSSGATTAVLDGIDDPIEEAAKDDPAEGARE
jgi:hypothetical protein